MSAEEITGQFIVDQAVFYLALVISVGTVMGLGFQGFRWLRNKQREDADREKQAMSKLIDERAANVKEIIENMRNEMAQHKELNNVLVKIEEQKGQLLKHEHILGDLSQIVKELRIKVNGQNHQQQQHEQKQQDSRRIT